MFVKICGLRTVNEVLCAVDAGADAIGLVFARSPRQVTLEEAVPLLAAIPAHVRSVAVFRTPDHEVLQAVLALNVWTIQADASWTTPLPAGVVRLPALCDGPDVAHQVDALEADWVLVDGPLGGGRGVAADPFRVARVAAKHRVILAGGLRPDTVAHAIRVVSPFGVDVSSGVESAPGIKDLAKIRAFVRAARSVEAK
ncbi:MAG: phosphoribosylanthranilate isomerase [Rhodobacterales bacterium]|nr:phosphoribosylanthranilate isomerase [Rhodobacterales bacterium]